MESEMQQFYKNKNIFLTGGSGFLGKAFIEKLLCVTDVECIYVLIRAKKGKSFEDRIAQMFNDPLYQSLFKQKPNAAQRVQPICGDCAQPSLGISKQDQEILCESVDIVVHGAATVRFNEPLSIALDINTRATQDLIDLAKRMKHLKAFVHVSSAFANCLVTHIEEMYYTHKLSASAAKIMAVKDTLGDAMVDKMSDVLCGKFPNTYTFTKALSEEVVLSQCDDLPICIFRPGIVIASYKEPVPGWIDNINGPTSILIGACHGVLRVMYARMESDAGVVPVDFCANLMIACAWATAINKHDKSHVPLPVIYNLVPDRNNTLKWGEFKRSVEVYGVHMPLTRMMWFPFLITTFSYFYYKLLCFVLHTMPGYLTDFVLLLMGRKRFMVKTYEKIHKTTDLILYFIKRDWSFDATNTYQLWSTLSPKDRELFDFDMRAVDWHMYFRNALVGIRCFLGKEEPTTIPQGIKLWKRLKIIHHTTQMLICSGGMALLWSFYKYLMYL